MIAMPEPDRGVLDRRAEIVEALEAHRPGRRRDRPADTNCAPSNATASPPIGSRRWSPCCPRRQRRSSRSCAIARRTRSRSCRAARAPRFRAARCRSPTAFSSAWASSTGSSRSTSPTAASSPQPGVTNLGITHAVQGLGLYYAPDPSSQIACTIGGNVAENSGGVHCLKYGLTTNNVIGVEMVTIEGEIVRLGGKHFDSAGYDLLGVMVGSEGMLGIVTEVTVRILPKPPGRARAADRLFHRRGRGRLRRRGDRRRDHSGRHGDHGPAGGRGGGGLRPCRLSARLRGAADRRARRLRGRGRSSDRRGRGDRRAPRGDELPGEPVRRGAAACSGPGARRRFPRSAASRPTITAWTERSRAERSAASSSG